MAKELAFYEAGRDRATVHFHQRPALPRTMVVHGTGNEFLARAGFTGDEHGGVGGRDHVDLPQHLQKRGTAADHLLEVVLLTNLFLEVDVLTLEPRPQRRDLLISLHVRERQCYLIGRLLEERR